MLAQRLGEIVVHRAEDIDLPDRRQLCTRIEGHPQVELFLHLVDDLPLHGGIGAAVDLVQAEGDLAADAVGEPARDDAEMAAVEHLQHHRLQEQHR